jgi:hypothetical protein
VPRYSRVPSSCDRAATILGRVLERYSNFFLANAGASAAFIGLLFVSLTIADRAESDQRARTNRDALAGSAFAQLLNAFFVSMGGLARPSADLRRLAAAMAVFGLWTTSRLLPGAIRAGNWARTSPVRTTNIVFPIASIVVYVLQLAFAIGLLFYPESSALLRLSVLVLLGLYAGAVARAWKITRTT